MIKVQIAVLNDPKEKIGSGFINPEGEYIAIDYKVDQDSVLGDGVHDALSEILDEEQLRHFYGDSQYDRHQKLNRKLAVEGLSEISADPESADRLKEFCLEYFDVLNEDLEFEIVYFHSLHDAEQNNQKEEISYNIVTDITADMFRDDMALYVELMGDNYHTSPIICIGWGDDQQIYIAEPEVVFASDDFKNWAKEKETKKQVFDAKRTYVALRRQKVDITSISFDILLASYLLNTKDNSKDLSEVAMEHDYYDVSSDESVYGKGAKIAIPEDKKVTYDHVARKIKAIRILSKQLSDNLEKNVQTKLFDEMELPLSIVLAEMELTGVKVNDKRLMEMKEEFAIRLNDIEQRVYELAGEKFNLNSPKIGRAHV